ncbi:group II intron reverse transcriptase/maturase [Fictibacillus nanhaiensis]|uniref:group II intron reverse transcriptase/maturase n=1 Tax=Fictibacillus nanhaiensis TaxID=742169 RepID=UPI00203ABB8B|nr:group II intron reverse transcriptase/maturase [Fictibacillus nanhaiensis]MCM3733562.1 group II intron reverse transcriptase/maturase [Fictibacillus nanhaiensis]
MMERIVSRENTLRALKRVEKNKGSHGVDQMPVQNLRAHMVENWNDLKSSLLSGTYIPSPVRRVEIPKPDGGVRKLGIPTVTDRFIQQAITQALTPIYDPTFSSCSFGFRPGKRAHDAVKLAQSYIREGYRWVVDIDLEKFFDKVNHDRLMTTLARTITDVSLIKLIRRYLQAGIMENGLTTMNVEGTPQGGPLSPLLSNIVLDELDKELERRGHRFVRYADDCNIYVKSRRAGERVMNAITLFIEKKLKLKVNRAKSAVDRPWKRKFLGFSFTHHKEPKVRISPSSIKRFKKKVRELTSRRWSIAMEHRIRELNKYLVGWMSYYSLAQTRTIIAGLEKWLSRRLRMICWKEWKNPRTRVRNLNSLGVRKDKAYEWGNSRKGYWRIAKSPILHKTLGKAYWLSRGLKSLTARYDFLRQT